MTYEILFKEPVKLQANNKEEALQRFAFLLAKSYVSDWFIATDKKRSEREEEDLVAFYLTEWGEDLKIDNKNLSDAQIREIAEKGAAAWFSGKYEGSQYDCLMRGYSDWQNANLPDELIRLDRVIAKKYLDCNEPFPFGCRRFAISYLQADIEAALRKAEDLISTKHEIEDLLAASWAYEKITSAHVVADAYIAASIRRDFAAAFQSVKHGWELSKSIGYSFFDSDIVELAKLHKANKYRKKIEELLEDCNFHSECGRMAANDYSDWLDTKESPCVERTRLARAERILADNGIEEDEVEVVLQAIGYALLDTELYPDRVQ